MLTATIQLNERENLIRAIADLEFQSSEFNTVALHVFAYQYKYNPLFKNFCDRLHKTPENVKSLSDVPFLPITFFKNKKIKTGDWTEETEFLSSGTTGTITSTHCVRDVAWYNAISQRGFEHFHGDLKKYCVLGLLPAYLERPGSSLVHMVNHFIRQSENDNSGFFLYNYDALKIYLEDNARSRIPTVLFGVTFALLDFVEKYTINTPELIVIETGGMKGRRNEIIRAELHEKLKRGFGVARIHSEYGMTELLSQAYLDADNLFEPIATLRVLSRDATDPFKILSEQTTNFVSLKNKNAPSKIPTGALNIIDLANLDTCSFIATDDLGKVHADGRFDVLGRMDNSDVRGCALLMLNE